MRREIHYGDISFQGDKIILGYGDKEGNMDSAFMVPNQLGPGCYTIRGIKEDIPNKGECLTKLEIELVSDEELKWLRQNADKEG